MSGKEERSAEFVSHRHRARLRYRRLPYASGTLHPKDTTGTTITVGSPTRDIVDIIVASSGMALGWGVAGGGIMQGTWDGGPEEGFEAWG